MTQNVGGRPRKEPPDKRTEQFNTRWTPAEAAHLEARMKLEEIETRADFITICVGIAMGTFPGMMRDRLRTVLAEDAVVREHLRHLQD